MDHTGRILHETKVASVPDALAAFLAGLGRPVTLVGLEAGPLSQWLSPGCVRLASEPC